MDIYLKRLAEVLVNYSTRVKSGDWVTLTGFGQAEPLLKELYAATLRAGGFPSVLMVPDWADYLLFSSGNREQVTFISPLAHLEMERADVRILVFAEQNTKRLSKLSPEPEQLRAQARRPLRQLMLQRMGNGSLRYCLTLLPTNAYAQDAEMSLDEYEAFVYGSGLLDDPDPVARWGEIAERQQRLVAWLSDKDHIHIRGENADLQMSVRGRRFASAHGNENFPDGEIYSSPVEHSVNGWVRFTYPAVLDGREITGIEFTFEEGRIVKASASKNQDALLGFLDTDAGARYLGELGIGTNPGITQFTRNTLFDEKIQGTFHLAVGAAFPELGGTNKSAIHEDIVCDLHDGEMLVDGELFYRNGDFVI